MDLPLSLCLSLLTLWCPPDPRPVRAVPGPVARRSGDGPPLCLHGGSRGASALVIVLPGGSFRGASAEERARRALGEVSHDARRLRLAVLVPLPPEDEATSVPFLEPAGETLVLTLLDEALEDTRLDPDRVTLAGFGAGATAALGLAAKHPRRFAAVAVWSGTPPPLWERRPDGGRELVGLAGDPVAGLGGVPVYLFTAEDDRVLDRACLALFVDGMRTAAARDPAWSLTWEQGRGGHAFGAKGPWKGLRFLAGHRRRSRP